jgi:eukaryotic-like serine/threonine-protein kinase
LGSVAIDASTGLPRGARIGGYAVEGAVGETTGATVYRAREAETGARVAIKRMARPGETARWEIEARLLSALDHPGIVALIDHFEEPEGVYNIVMDLVDGPDLARRLWDQGNPGLPVEAALGWARQACAAVQYLHDQHLVHGDVKPRNLVVGGGGRAMLIDFGQATRLADAAGAAATGGTARYVAPEVFAGDAAGPRSDVYALAATAFTLLTGRPPAYGEDVARMAVRDLPDATREALRAGLARAPEDRTPSAAELARALGAAGDGAHGVSLAVSREDAGLDRPLLETVVRAAAGVFEAAAVSISVSAPATGAIEYVAAWGPGAAEVVGMRLERGRGIAGAVIEQGQAQAVARCRTDPRFAAAVAAGTGYVPHTMLVVPLRDGAGRAIGALSVLDRRDGGPYGPSDIPRGELFAEVAAATLAG